MSLPSCLLFLVGELSGVWGRAGHILGLGYHQARKCKEEVDVPHHSQENGITISVFLMLFSWVLPFPVNPLLRSSIYSVCVA